MRSSRWILLCGLLSFASVVQAQNIFDSLFGGAFRPPQPVPRPRMTPPPPATNPWWGVENPSRYAHLAEYGAWRLTKTAWTVEDEQGYSNFVRALGRSGCKTVDSCLRSPANPFRDSDPPAGTYTFWSDCADWPYFLRSYYAWKNGLPMLVASGMVALPLTPQQQQAVASGQQKAQNDVRYSWNGNKPTRRLRLPDPNGTTNFFEVHTDLQNTVHTATMRIDPRTNYGDLYSPAIMPGAIRPGTAVYDPAGHVGVVYDITADGQVMVFDALVDGKSISPRRPYSGDHYGRSKIAHGGWFQNFRPVIVEGASFDNYQGSYVGGKARALTNQEIRDFSIEMFGTTETEDGRSAYLVQTEIGIKVTNSFQEFLRRRLFQGRFKLDVLSEFQIRLKSVCDEFGSRVGLVQAATQKGVAAQPHAAILPNTIYGGDGDWDTYSTPAGDVRRRNSVNNVVLAAKELKSLIDSRNPDYIYRGQDLKGDLIRLAEDAQRSCAITYTNTAGQPVKLTLAELLRRLPRMSFSPWHCIELRWGASSNQELASCPDLRSSNKIRWYNAQQTLRNQMVRDTNIFTGYRLEELESRASELGPATPANFNLIDRLQKEL